MQNQPWGDPSYTPNQTTYRQGCLSAAMSDIGMGGVNVGRFVLLALIMCVPILNFVVTGYLLNWSREVPYGGRTPMPGKIVSGRNFETGFYAFLIEIVFGLVLCVAMVVLVFIPFLGWLAIVVLGFAFGMFVYLAEMRMAMECRLGAGFEFGICLSALKRNWTSALFVAVVPGLVGSVVSSAVSGLLLMMVGMGAVVPVLAGVSMDFSGAFAVIVGSGAAGVVALLVAWLVGSVTNVAVQAVSFRAMGHWVGRNASDWARPPVSGYYHYQNPSPGAQGNIGGPSAG